MMHWLLFRRKSSWPTRGPIPEFSDGRGTEENPEISERGWRVSLPRFEPSTFRIRFENVISLPVHFFIASGVGISPLY